MPSYNFDKKNAVGALIKSGQKGEFTDPKTTGLQLRIAAKTASWRIKGRIKGQPKNSTWTIARHDEITVAEARRRARQAMLMVGAGENPTDWLQEQRLGHAPNPIVEIEWPWERVLALYIEAKSHLTHESKRSLTQMLTYPEVGKQLAGKDAAKITKDDLIIIRDSIRAKGVLTQASGSIRNLNALVRYMRKERPDIGMQDATINVTPGKTRDKNKNTVNRIIPLSRLPQLEQCFRNCKDLTAHQKLSAILTLYTAQRVSSICSAKVEDFIEDEDDEGWLIWTVGHTKRQIDLGKPGHVIPLPPVAADLIKAAMSSISNSKWIFPQQKKGKVNVDKGSHMYPSQIAKAFRVAEIGYTPHAVRHAFTTHLGEKYGISDFETGKILHHAESEKSTTRVYYSFSRDIKVKKEIMSAWMELLLNS